MSKPKGTLGVRISEEDRKRIAVKVKSIHPELKPSSWVRSLIHAALEEPARKVG